MILSEKKILLLNSNWCALGIIGIPKAIGLLYSSYSDGEPKARIITPPPKGKYEIWEWKDWSCLRPENGEKGLVSSSAIYKIPEVIILSKYGSFPDRRVKFCRKAIWKRDNFTCQYCGKKPKEDECTLDHVVPKSLGGETSWTNCVLACYKCNSQKADKIPENAKKPNDKNKAQKWIGPSPMRLIKKPIKPSCCMIKEKIKILDTWKHWLDKLYWEVPLDNDMESTTWN